MHFVIIKTFEIITLHTKYISHILYNINTFNIEDARDTILKKKKDNNENTFYITLSYQVHARVATNSKNTFLISIFRILINFRKRQTIVYSCCVRRKNTYCSERDTT